MWLTDVAETEVSELLVEDPWDRTLHWHSCRIIGGEVRAGERGPWTEIRRGQIISHVRRDLPSRTVTFLFTDIEASTKLLHELGPQAYAVALSEHRRALRGAFSRHGGVEVDTQGDAFFVAFPTAAGGVGAAADAQQALGAGPIRVRMGLHTGTPDLTEEGYVGVDVHKGARIASAGHGGQVLLSRETRDLVEVEVTDLGEHRLKDFEEPVWIFQMGRERFPPLKTISNTNLPRPVSSFIGREKEVGEIATLLGGASRLLTLTGPGGSGKTRLGIEAAAEALPLFKAGVFWIGLASVEDPALVTDTIANTIGAKDGLSEHVGEREMLLLLDNFEQVIEAARELSSLLAACPNLKVMVTSRELLRLRGEVEYPVPPLAGPEAVDLFRARSGVEADGTVTELCRRLDNLPLAVELAAARTSVLSPRQILDRLSTRLDALKGGRDADPRQRTLRATIEWSYDLLGEEEQGLFARLAVFPGGCTLEAADEVAAADVDTLQSLVDKSLLRRQSDGRFWMLETIREYATERFQGAADGEEVRRRQAEYFTAMATESDEATGVESEQLFQLLEDEQANLRSALEWACGGADPGIALRLSGALWRLWWNLGAAREGAGWYERALAVGRDQPEQLRAMAEYGAANMAMVRNDPLQATGLLERCLVVFRRHDDTLRTMRTLNDLGIAAQMSGDNARARRYHEESLGFALASGDERSAAAARINLANAAMAEDRPDDAVSLLRQVVSAMRPLGDRAVVGTALQTLSLIDLRWGDLAGAANHLRESISLCREVHEWRTVEHALAVAAAVVARNGDPMSAVRALAACAKLSEDTGAVLETPERLLSEQIRGETRVALGDEAYNEAMTEAMELPPDVLVERVLADLG